MEAVVCIADWPVLQYYQTKEVSMVLVCAGFRDEDQHEIFVSGCFPFPMNRWREAILYFLFGVWGDEEQVMHHPEITFGNVALALDPRTRRYRAFGVSPEATIETMFRRGGTTLQVGAEQEEVERGLIRFVKNEGICALSIMFPGGGVLRLWKTSRRGEYRCQAVDIPTER